MSKRLRRHLNPPMVVSMIALFVALGGGYAVAFSGSGSLQKGNVVGFPNNSSTFTTVRSLTGIGSIQVACSAGDLNLRFHNSSGKTIWYDESVTSDAGFEGAAEASVANGANRDTGFLLPPTSGIFYKYHVYLHASGSKAPQADIQVGLGPAASNVCAVAEVSVLALNTQQ